MKLERVRIKNFRSIKEIEIVFDPTCRVLVGINESGKSNILRALSFLSEEEKYKPDKKNDLREALSHEKKIKDSYIKFDLKFEKEESIQLIESVSSKILASAKDPYIVSSNGKNERISKFCTTRNKGIYNVDILRETKSPRCYTLGENCNLLEGWKKPAQFCPEELNVELSGQKYEIKQYELVRATDFPNTPEEYLEDARIEDLAKLYRDAIRNIIRENLPNTLFWEYDETNFLPDSVEIESFAENPDSCAPLRNMFTLAGENDIEESIKQEREGTDNQFQSYLNRIAKTTTKHFRTVWKDYRNIEFSLQLNASRITPGIKEENIYGFTQRSDGFKRFVTFLLMVSANVKTNKIRNNLLLIDEPEVSLHPSGARYLQEELTNISKKNYVAYSTHSIFMIDQKNIKRHYIVKKKNEITSVEPAQESNLRDEEVLYNALGFSMFFILEENNLIFEGWNDKQLFKIALREAEANLQQKYKDVGLCHADGVRTIGRITPMIELANRSCLIVSDSDDAAKNHKRTHEMSGGFGNWKTYQDIDPSIKAITGEDFIKNDFIIKQIKIALSESETPDFHGTILADRKNKLSKIRKWLRNDCGMTDEEMKNKIAEIKKLIFQNLKYENIEYGEYLKLLEGISFNDN